VSSQHGAIKLVIIGASGRMGLSLLKLLPQFPGLKLHAAVAGSQSPALGRDSGELAGGARNGIAVTSDLEGALHGADVVLDFSSAEAAYRAVPLCAAAGAALLLGTTGWGPDLQPALTRAAKRIPLLVAPNTSLGAAVLLDLVRRAGAALGPGFEVRVHDRHHRAKRDAPSGTALALGQAALEGQGGAGPVGYSSIREGDVVGEHEVQFLGVGEQIHLGHIATDRAIFANGALRAALWLSRQRPGTYQMADILKEK
jgi:4-hydroxy-tetrahydrodipicolinate reductase